MLLCFVWGTSAHISAREEQCGAQKCGAHAFHHVCRRVGGVVCRFGIFWGGSILLRTGSGHGSWVINHRLFFIKLEDDTCPVEPAKFVCTSEKIEMKLLHNRCKARVYCYRTRKCNILMISEAKEEVLKKKTKNHLSNLVTNLKT